MKLTLRYLKIIPSVGIAFSLTGCAQVETARQWWEVWRNPAITSKPTVLSSSKVTIDLIKIARQHPAWKLAQEMESSPLPSLRLDWTQPASLSMTNFAFNKSTFAPQDARLTTEDFAESEEWVAAQDIESLTAQMMREQQATWKAWSDAIGEHLQEDRTQIATAMRVDLEDRINATQKNIPTIGQPLTPSAEIQNEMINLRLKLLNNVVLSPDDKEATQQRLDELEAQWALQLRQQAQAGADRQQYWRETVPRQMREAGESTIQQVMTTLQQKDQKAIDLTLNSQQTWLQQDDARSSVLGVKLPEINNIAMHTKSTFRMPTISTKIIETNIQPLKAPAAQVAPKLDAAQREIRELKQMAMAAAARAAEQSATTHHWEWVATNTGDTSSLPDATSLVLQETQF